MIDRKQNNTGKEDSAWYLAREYVQRYVERPDLLGYDILISIIALSAEQPDYDLKELCSQYAASHLTSSEISGRRCYSLARNCYLHTDVCIKQKFLTFVVNGRN